MIGTAAGVAVIVVVLLVVLLTRGGSKPSTSAKPSPTPSATPSATPLPTPLAAVPATVSEQPIDGIQCQATEQTTYHVHAHVAIFVNGTERSIPQGIGVAPPVSTVPSNEGPYVESGKCFYWLHTHSDDGIIHVEAPAQSQLTLGQFFDIWQQPLSSSGVGPDNGTLTVYVDGKKFTGDPRTIVFTAHELVQLDVGTDVAPKEFSFPPGL